MSDTQYCYVLVRRDIPLPDQIVQVGHACIDAGRKWPQDLRDDTHLVLLSVADREELDQALMRLEHKEIPYTVFDEPDDNLGYTAACTAPLTGKVRHAMRAYSLWNP